MDNRATELTATVDEGELEDLEVALVDAVTRRDRGVDLDARGSGTAQVVTNSELRREVVPEILHFYERGLRIAPFTESTPLSRYSMLSELRCHQNSRFNADKASNIIWSK